MIRLSRRLFIKYQAFVFFILNMPLKAVFAISVLIVTNNLHTVDDINSLGITATPIQVEVYDSLSSTAPCDSVASLLPGATCSFLVDNQKCAAITHFVVTPLASNASGTVYPYGSTPIDTTISASGLFAAYLVADTGTGIAPSGSTLINGVPSACLTSGTPGTDGSFPPLIDVSSSYPYTSNGIVLCPGSPGIVAYGS